MRSSRHFKTYSITRITKKTFDSKKKRVKREFLALVAGSKGTVKLDKKKANTHLYRKRKKKSKRLNMRDFNNVISIDKKNNVAEVEGMISYYDFAQETLKEGYIPQVVPELRSLTVGGVSTGIGVESTSFRHGLVHETLEELEILTGSGEIVVATPRNKHKDLFFGFPNSYATFGYILRAKIGIMPAKPFVRLEYLKFKNLDEYFKVMETYCNDKSVDFIDGAIFNKKLSVLVVGTMVDEAPFTSNYRSRGIFYKAIQKRQVDYLTIHDYLWRWDADSFWSTRNTPLQNPIFRYFFGERILRSDTIYKIGMRWKKVLNVYRALRGTVVEEVIQDPGIAISKSADFVRWFLKKVDMDVPLWICPVRPIRLPGSYPLFSYPKEIHCDIGFYGAKEHLKGEKDPFFYNKLVEDKIIELKGTKALYSMSFFDKKTFWKLFNKPAYDKLKKKYDPEGRFLDLYQKTVQNF